MDILLGDLRYAFRSLKRRPAFAFVVIGTMAVAIGATTTMMGVVDAAIVRPLPFHDAPRLVLAQGYVSREQDIRGISYLEAMDWRSMSRAFDELSAYGEISLNVSDASGEPQQVESEIVSESFFRVLGVSAPHGRTFTPDEDRVPNAHPVAVIGHGLWQSRFGGARNIVGRSITVNAQPFTIVGVAPPGFRGLSFDSELWIPMMMVSTIRSVSALEDRSSRWLRMVGRLKEGHGVEDAQADLDRVTLQLERTYPQFNTDRGARLTPLQTFYLGTTKTLLLALFGAVGFLLLIACANVMGLQLVRAASRRREMAMRTALGAARSRLVRQLVIEGLVLAAGGAAGGILLSAWAIDVLLPLVPDGLIPTYNEVTIDLRVLGFTVLVAALAGIVFGLAPALARSRRDLVSALKDGAPSAAAGLGSARRLRAQQLFVVGEVALSLVLLAGAALFLQSLQRQLGIDPGFRADGAVAARVMMPPERYGREDRVRFVAQLLERLQNTPGVHAAAVGSDLPLRGLESGGHLTYDGGPADGVLYARHRVSPEYFATLGIRLERGRLIAPTDGPDTPPVAVISAAMARRLWPDRDPVGQRFDAGTSPVEVVGVVSDVRFRDLTSDLHQPLSSVDVYYPFAQETDETIEILVQSEREVSGVASIVRRAVAELDPTLALYEVAALSEAVRQQTAAPRFGSSMLSVFAFIAILLAAVGVYGLLAFVVGASSRDIAIRMALGARAGSVVADVVRRGMTLAVAGGVVGLLIAVPSTRVLTTFLVGVKANDPVTMAGVTLFVLAVSLVSCWIPARRASRVSPQGVLKAD
jgi:putative ABC transport system permease protein